MKTRSVFARELLPGQRVKLGCEPFSTATVEGVGPDEVALVKPYIHTSDFTYERTSRHSYSEARGQMVIAYVGLEKFCVPMDHRLEVFEESYPGPRTAFREEEAAQMAATIEEATGRRQKVVPSGAAPFGVVDDR